MERREGGRKEKNIAHGRENTQNFFFGVFFGGVGGLWNIYLHVFMCYMIDSRAKSQCKELPWRHVGSFNSFLNFLFLLP